VPLKGRLDRDRPHRGPGGHRRQQRQFPHRRLAEETAFQLNLLAAKEIARQLRLRDLGGVIVNDFIDMRKEKHRRGVERALRDAMKRDRARTKILRTSPFGLIEMTRQRIRPSLKRSVYPIAPAANGRGRGEDRREHVDRSRPHADAGQPAA
jgi:Rne/Rng family ribonuclease